MVTRTYRLKIARPGQEFEAEGDKAFVLEMLKRFGSTAAAVPQATSESRGRKGEEKKSRTPSPFEGKAVSIREFVQQLGFKKHTDITLAFGYYLEHHADTKEFTAADINNCYYEAKMESSNTSQMIIQNIRRGHMMLAKKGDKKKKRYTVTTSGENFIETKLRGGA